MRWLELAVHARLLVSVNEHVSLQTDCVSFGI